MFHNLNFVNNPNCMTESALAAGLEVDPSRLFCLFYRVSAVSGSLYRVVRPTPDEHASDDTSGYSPTSRANSQVARDILRKEQSRPQIASIKERPR